MDKSQKVAEWLTPERQAEHARIRAELDTEYPELKQKARESRQARMRDGAPPTGLDICSSGSAQSRVLATRR